MSLYYIANKNMISSDVELARSLMMRIFINEKIIYVSPCHLLDASFEYFSRLLFPEKYGFGSLPSDEQGSYVSYEISDSETEEGIENAFKHLHYTTCNGYQDSRAITVSVRTFISLHKWLVPSGRYRLDIKSLTLADFEMIKHRWDWCNVRDLIDKLIKETNDEDLKIYLKEERYKLCSSESNNLLETLLKMLLR